MRITEPSVPPATSAKPGSSPPREAGGEISTNAPLPGGESTKIVDCSTDPIVLWLAMIGRQLLEPWPMSREGKPERRGGTLSWLNVVHVAPASELNAYAVRRLVPGLSESSATIMIA